MIVSKVTKNQAFALSLEDIYFEKPHGGGGEGKLIPCPNNVRVKAGIFILLYTTKNMLFGDGL